MKFNWRWWLGLKPKIASEPLKYDYTISVVIPAYNEEKSIARTIYSVISQTAKIEEIIVIDDCSTDRTAKVVKKAGEIAKKNKVTVVKTPKNMGTKARAQNYVLPLIKTELFVTIDADTILHPEAIQRTLPYFNDERTGSVCGFVIPQKIETVWEKGRFIEYLFGITIMKAAQNNVNAVLVSSGCFSIFKTDIVRNLGGFKSRSMAEDMDLTWEMHFNSYRVYCAPDAYCYPLDPPTFHVFVNQVLRWYSSFFQNISIHKKELLKNKLGIFIYGYLFDAMLSPVILIAGLTALTGNVLYAIPLSFVIDLIIVSIPCFFKAIRIGMCKKTAKSLLVYPIIRFVNLYVFWRAFWNEWIVRKRLTSWDKGH